MTTKPLNNVEVQVKSTFIPERSDPQNGLFFYAYNVTITNSGDQPCQLLTRHWVITDALGNEEEVKGPGVVGETPKLEVGQSFNSPASARSRRPSAR